METGIGENEAGADDVPDEERRGSSRADGTDHPADERQERHDQRGGGGEAVERLLDRPRARVGDRARRDDDRRCQNWGVCGLLSG